MTVLLSALFTTWFVYTVKARWTARRQWTFLPLDVKAFYLLVTPPLGLAVDVLLLLDRLFYSPKTPKSHCRKDVVKSAIAFVTVVVCEAPTSSAVEQPARKQGSTMSQIQRLLHTPRCLPRPQLGLEGSRVLASAFAADAAGGYSNSAPKPRNVAQPQRRNSADQSSKKTALPFQRPCLTSSASSSSGISRPFPSSTTASSPACVPLAAASEASFAVLATTNDWLWAPLKTTR